MIHSTTATSALTLMSMGMGYMHDYRLFSTPLTPVHNLNFNWLNQRQLRKNKRRKHAAGFKNAFN